MKIILAATILALLAVNSLQNVNAKCGKTSAFRYEFESWWRQYVLETMTNTTASIVDIYRIAISDLELETETRISFEKGLYYWLHFERKLRVPIEDIEPILLEFRWRAEDFEKHKDILLVIANKRLNEMIEDFDKIGDQLAEKFSKAIYDDWISFYKSQDFETLAQQKDCKAINEIIENMQQDKQKGVALIEMSRALFEIYDLQKWANLMDKKKKCEC